MNHYQQTIAKTDQKENVNEEPRQPCEISRDMKFPDLRDGGGAADGGKAAFVVIVERRGLGQ